MPNWMPESLARATLLIAVAIGCSSALAESRPPLAKQSDLQKAAVSCEMNLMTYLVVRQKARVTIAVDGDQVSAVELKATPASAAVVRRLCRGIDDATLEAGDSAHRTPVTAAAN